MLNNAMICNWEIGLKNSADGVFPVQSNMLVENDGIAEKTIFTLSQENSGAAI